MSVRIAMAARGALAVLAIAALALRAGTTRSAPATAPASTAPAPTAPGTAPPARHASLPAVSPDGRHIAFVSDRDDPAWELYVVGADGRDTRRLTYTPEEELVPDWSADGRQIRYVTFPADTAAELHAIALDADAGHLLEAPLATELKLSRRGDRIAYTAGNWTRNRLMVTNLDGSARRALTDSSGRQFNLAWSPHDDRIAVTRRDSTGVVQVWVMNADGSSAQAITHFTANDGRPQWPAWSPDGRRIAIQSGTYNRAHPDSSDAHIWVVELSSGRATQLARHDRPWLDETPSWFPNGKRLAFQSTRSGRFEIWVMNADGSGERQLTR